MESRDVTKYYRSIAYHEAGHLIAFIECGFTEPSAVINATLEDLEAGPLDCRQELHEIGLGSAIWNPAPWTTKLQCAIGGMAGVIAELLSDDSSSDDDKLYHAFDDYGCGGEDEFASHDWHRMEPWFSEKLGKVADWDSIDECDDGWKFKWALVELTADLIRRRWENVETAAECLLDNRKCDGFDLAELGLLNTWNTYKPDELIDSTIKVIDSRFDD